MYDEYKDCEHIPCVECWKGHMAEMKVYVYITVIGEKQTLPLITTHYFCTNCQKLKEEL